MKFVSVLLLLLIIGCSSLTAVEPANEVDWPAFMARHDLVWDPLPARWREGAFLGNGQLGLMIYQPSEPHGGDIFGFSHREEEENSLRFDLGRSDLIDHREGRRVLFDRTRLPIGHFLLTPVGKITGGTMRLDLWNAEATGTVTTDRGEIHWRALIPSQQDVMIVEFTPSEGERDCTWEYVAAVSETPRIYRWDTDGYGRDRSQGKYPANPPAERSARGPFTISRQPMLAGGDYATAWRRDRVGEHQQRVTIAVGYNKKEPTSSDQAVDAIERASAVSFESLESAHRRWWHTYYPQSFLSIPDSWMESFYWIQMYKLGAGTRGDRPALDLMGPWYRYTIWPGMWWNLNLQLSYYPVYTANRLNIGESLARMIDDSAQDLIDNVPEHAQGRGAFKGIDFSSYGESAWVARATASQDLDGGMFKGQRGTVEMGNLTWALHNYWRQCRYAADDQRLRDRMLPMLRRAINFYRPMLERDEAGTYHLAPTYSPEVGYGPDCNYDLALLRWGLRTLIAESKRLGVDDPLMPEWKKIHTNLTDYPTDENGYMIARGVPFKGGHRHYSHLLMIYPLHLVHWDQPDQRELIARSVNQWAAERKAFAGYSYSGAASMYASMGDGDRAATYTDELIDCMLTPNTMYMEADSPVIESPLSGAQSVHDMLLQSWSTWTDDATLVSTIRVFPAIPEDWSQAAFADLRTEGAFLVSAVRSDHKTQWVAIKSLAGEPCRIKPNLEGTVRAVDSSKNDKIHPLGEGLYKLDLDRGETMVLHAGDAPPTMRINALAGEADRFNYFGSQAMRDD